MKLSFCWLLTAAFVMNTFLAEAQTRHSASLAQTVQANHWKKRLLLIGAPTAGQTELKQQQKLLAATPDQLNERDFLVLEVPYDQLTPADRQYWTQELKQPLSIFTVVLIGKDGGVKRTATQPLAPADLFATVDKMPMRRTEMQRPKRGL